MVIITASSHNFQKLYFVNKEIEAHSKELVVLWHWYLAELMFELSNIKTNVLFKILQGITELNGYNKIVRFWSFQAARGMLHVTYTDTALAISTHIIWSTQTLIYTNR